MRKALLLAAGPLLSILGLALLYLTNTGMVILGKPYIVRISPELYNETIAVAFVNVNVIPMDREHVLQNQTVLIRNGLIEKIGDEGSVEAPADALVIEGQGNYLMPGLVDMHVHVKEENELLLFVASGVTTVRDMWGTTGLQLWLGFPDQLVMRSRIDQGQLFGPTIYTAGPIMEGQPPTSPIMPVFRTPAEAERSVMWQKEQGYDFVKVYDNLTTETYDAVLKTAESVGLPVVGHVPGQVGLEAVLSGGQLTIEHLTGYIDPDAAAFIIPEERLAEYAEMTRDAGVWNTPTLGLYQKLVPASEVERLRHQPGMAYVSPRRKVLWDFFLKQMRSSLTYEGADYPGRIAEINRKMTKSLYDAGAKLLLGTDTDNPYLVPGFSLHEELAYLVDAGLSPYAALEAGTRNAAEALGRLSEFGTVGEGKRADLVLLEANPLEDVAHASQRVGVMLRGRWLPESQLQDMLLALKDSYRPSLLDRVWPAGLLALGLSFAAWAAFRMRR
jgi:imidazolonepropionase-like amidohydrolase